MANDTGAYGLKPLYSRGGDNAQQVQKMYVSSSYATALFVGDPVNWNPLAAYSDTTGMHQSVVVAAAIDSGHWAGVIVGIEPIQTNLNLNYIPASTGGYVYICTDPNMVYKVRGDGGATPTKSIVGNTAGLIATASGNTSTGVSGYHLDEGTTTTPAKTQTLPLLILALHNKADNTLGINAEYEVMINTVINTAGRYDGVLAT